MASLAHLFLVACVLALSQGASIPVEAELKKISAIPEDIKEPVPIAATPAETVEQNEPVKEIGNELRADPVGVIPVEVVVENVEPLVKANEVVDEDDVKRPQLDLRNPGPPQRQEHETQNPEYFSENALQVAAIKENIEQTRIMLRQGFQGVTEDIQNWFTANDQLKIQSNIQNFRSTFVAQIKKLDDALHSLAKHEDSVPSESQKEPIKLKSDLVKIESGLKTMQNNFQNGVETLSEGVNLIGMLKSAQTNSGRQEAANGAESPAPSPAQSSTSEPAQPAQPTQPQNVLAQYWTYLNNVVSDSLSNVTTSFNNLITGQSNQPINTQADQDETTTRRPLQFPILPPILQNFNQWISGNGNANPPSQDGSAGGSAPASGIQGLWGQFTQFLPAQFRPPPAPSSESAGAGPASESKPSETKPEAEKPAEASSGSQSAEKPNDQAQQPAAQPASNSQPAAAPVPQQDGPIRQMLNNNPVVQGIASAVQRITNSITNPERPRETEEKKDPSPLTKGVVIFAKPPHRPGSGDNNDFSGSGVSDDTQPSQDITNPKATPAADQTE